MLISDFIKRSVVCGFTIMAAGLFASAQSSQPAHAVSLRPAGAVPLTASVAAESFQMFKNKNFDGHMNQVSEVTGKPSWSAQAVAVKSRDKVSSLRWNLPRGVIVTLFENDNGTGRQISLFGSGEVANLSGWKINDKITSWSWNFVGGVNDPTERIRNGKSPRPKYAKETDSAGADSLHLFKDHEVKGTSAVIEHVTSKPQGMFHEMPKDIGKRASSVKWKLPEGAVVVLAEHKNGEGPQVTLWGDGRFDEFTVWQMNDKAAYWAWYDVGEISNVP